MKNKVMKLEGGFVGKTMVIKNDPPIGAFRRVERETF